MKTNPKSNRQSGFALIVTLSLMILLTVIAVGLLTLSSITLRSTSQGSSQAIANSNAKLALMIAIGDLQKALGPDQRISANASSFFSTTANPAPQPNVVGAWDGFGWVGPTGDAPSPSNKAAKFRTWLISSKNIADTNAFDFPSGEVSDPIPLVREGTLPAGASGNPEMTAGRIPLTIGKSRGGVAWMVTDNSTRAPLNIAEVNSEVLVENVANRTAGTAPRPDVLSEAFKDLEPARVISMQTAVLAVGAGKKQEVNGRTQSLTTSSLGLLTNPVTGGLKTDLTPLFEGTTNITNLGGQQSPYFTTNDGAPSWPFLRTHYQMYKKVLTPAGGKPRYRLGSSDMVPSTLGIQPKPSREILLPVIAKLQIIFSLVSHHAHISDRVAAFNSVAVPQGNTKHAVPHLVYDPVITLYNPYDVELELSQLRIQVSDPPVGFQFQKHDMALGTSAWYRQEFGSGEYQGLARFQIANERNVDARKTFTLQLKNMDHAGSQLGNIILLPGEVKVFSPRVETYWTWGLEAGNGYSPRSFFDWENSRNMGNWDNRRNPVNKFGVEGIAKLDFRAGLQTDHLSYGGGGRPTNLNYSWENGNSATGSGWLSMKTTDDVTVNCRPQRCVRTTGLPDFRVDILAGTNETATSDILRTYEFRMADVPSEMSTTGNATKPITRRFNNGDLVQAPADTSAGGKSPFAIFTMSAKTTKDQRDDSKAWLFNNMVTEGGSHDSSKIGNAAQSYDLRLQEISEFTTFPGVEWDDKYSRGYFGAKANVNSGVSVVPMYRVPLAPAASLGDWIAANLITSSQFPRVNYPLGNSFAHPMIPGDKISANSPMGGGARVLDHTYLMNAALWDGYFFSSAAAYTTAAFPSTRAKAKVLENFFTGEKPMLNSRLIPYISGDGDAEDLANEYATMNDSVSSKKFASNAMISGAFNVNSDSIDAWRAVLSSLRDASVVGYTRKLNKMDAKTAFVRGGLPVAGSADEANPTNSVNALGQIRWAGFRTLEDSQIKELAEFIVEEIRARGKEDSAPSLCLADFINRRVGSSSGVHALKGILQTAIERSKVNEKFHKLDSNAISGAALAANRTNGLPNKPALDGNTADGAAPMLTQGDLLTGLAPFITARGDTFTIRAYGEARNSAGSSVVARAWCEATVQRIPAFVDSTDAPDALPTALTTSNQNFGRRFVITSFRWLNAGEI
ncbi:MAG: hypothetical protein V4689_23065 [Verrucomicrobiota bacterium]